MLDRLGDSQFIGRTREIGMLEAGLRDAHAGHGRAVAVVGEPGIGKTRLVEEFTARLDGAAQQILWGRCPEGGGAPAYWPWRQALAPLVEGERTDAASDDPALRDTRALIATQLGARAAGSAPSARERFDLLEAVVQLLHVAAQHAPLVLVLDDVHWADEASLRLLAWVVRELRGSRVLLVSTYREPEMRRRAKLLGDIARFSRRIGLHGLGRAEIAALVTMHGTPPSEAMVSRLEEVTDGNPFFLDELVTVLQEAGALDSDGDAVATLELPAGARETIRRRIEPLAADDQALLELAAVIGRDFSTAVLAAASGLTPDVVLGRLAEALAAGLVHDVGALGAFRFSHALVREALYVGLRPADRVHAHRRVALGLEQAREQGIDVPLAALAHHFFLAVPLGEAAKASSHAEQAAVAAMRQRAYDEATTQFDRALAALGFAEDDPPRRLRLLLAYGDAAQRAGDVGRAADVFLRAARLARAQHDVASLAIAAIRHAFARGAFAVAEPVVVELLETALAAVGEEMPALRVVLLTTLSSALLFSGERARCAALCAEALVTARALAEPRALATALMAQHCVLLGSPDAEHRLALADEALGYARTAARADTECAAWALRINGLLEIGEVADAEREVAGLARLAEASRLPLLRWTALVAQATLALLAGRFADGERSAAEAIAVRRRGEDAAVRQIFVVQSLFRRLETGGVGDLEETLAHCARDFPHDRGWRSSVALVLAETGRHDEARALFAQLAALDFADVEADANFLGHMAVLAMLVHRLGDAPRARRLHARLAPYASRAVANFVQPVVCLGSVARYLGLLADAMGAPELAAAHFTDAIAANERLGALPYVARSKMELARVLLGRSAPGDREAATRLLAEAGSTAGAIGQHRLREELAAVKVELPPAPTAATLSAAIRKEGDLWTVGYGADSFHLKDSKGIVFLATLLRSPGRDVHVLDLLDPMAGARDAAHPRDAGDAGELLDPTARAAYKRRLADLQDDLEEAERFADLGRAERARHEIDFLTAELARGVGLGGRARRAGSAAERARQNVCRTIAAALKKIADVSPGLGQHLAATVSTGMFCCYDPRLAEPLLWTF